MSFKSILVAIFGKPLSGMQKENPCLAATMKWQEDQAKQGKEVGMVWYCIEGRFDLFHCVGYEWINGERQYYDPQANRRIKLKARELIGANHIPFNFAAEIVNEKEGIKTDGTH